MKSFIKKTILFLTPIILVFFSGLIIPATPRASKSLLFANRQKDSLLLYTKEPRIIFVGGSNLSFGLNSYMIKDCLSLNPINTAVHASIGAKYMLENTLKYIRKGDIIIIAFEYSHFYRPYDYVSDELLRTIFDVFPEKKKDLSLKQIVNLLQYVPKFTLTKFKPTEYYNMKESDIYSVNSFNKFGDAEAHWNMNKTGYQPSAIQGVFNQNVIRKIRQFEDAVRIKGGIVYITFPSLDEISFSNSEEKVLLVENKLKENEFKLLGNAEKYIMPKEMMFNTSYHLNKKGVDHRTKLFIEDYNARKHNDGNVSFFIDF